MRSPIVEHTATDDAALAVVAGFTNGGCRPNAVPGPWVDGEFRVAVLPTAEVDEQRDALRLSPCVLGVSGVAEATRPDRRVVVSSRSDCALDTKAG